MTRADRRGAPLAVPLALLRLVLTVHALAALAQPVLAGQFLSGNFDMVELHGANAILVQLLGLTQIVTAVLLRWPGRGPQWPIWASLLLFLAEGMQAGFGYTRQIDLHVPLGVAIVAGVSVMLVWVWRPRLGRPRPAPESDGEAIDHAAITP